MTIIDIGGQAFETDGSYEAGELVKESVATSSIARGTWSTDVAARLQEMCDDFADAGEVVEFWGTDDDGFAWRVHLRR